VLYLDASAIVKLVRTEPESAALVDVVRGEPERVASSIAWTEVVRVTRRARTSVDDAIAVLEGIDLIPADDGILRAAGQIEPTTLKTLDAIHVATALSVREDLTAFVAYDDRLISAARRLGLAVRSPGR